jgi:hypothetical protein
MAAAARHRYISPMRRSTRFGLFAVLALLVLAATYAAYWWIVAGQIKDGLAAWQQSEKAHKIDASWRALRVTGFPFAFRVRIEDAACRDRAWNPAPELRLAHLTGTARPWDFADWRLAAPDGIAAALAPVRGRPALRLAAESADGSVAIGPRGASSLWLSLHDIAAGAASNVRAKSADAWIILPAKPAVKDTDPSLGLALALRQVGIPTPPADFANTIDELAFGVTVKGAVPDGPLARAVAAWRDAGGTVEVDNLHLKWGGLGVTANGTLALDQGLQPIAAFSGGIEGFGAILDAMVAADQLTPEQAALIQIGLTSLSKPGPDGQPQITAPFTIQNGKMYLGPARLGTAPHIVWE